MRNSRKTKKRGKGLLGKVLNAIMEVPRPHIATRRIGIRHYSPPSRVIMPSSLIVPTPTIVSPPLVSQTVLLQPNQNFVSNGITFNNRKGHTDSDYEDDCNMNYNSFLGSNLNNDSNCFTSLSQNNGFTSQNINNNLNPNASYNSQNINYMNQSSVNNNWDNFVNSINSFFSDVGKKISNTMKDYEIDKKINSTAIYLANKGEEVANSEIVKNLTQSAEESFNTIKRKTNERLHTINRSKK